MEFFTGLKNALIIQVVIALLAWGCYLLIWG
jgi:hypothetical protein